MAEAENYSEAISLLNKLIEKDPNNISFLLNRGVYKSYLNQIDESNNDFIKVIEIDSNNTLAYFNFGKNNKYLENYEVAVDAFKKAVNTKGGELLYIEKNKNSIIDNGHIFDVRMEEIIFERGEAYFKLNNSTLAFDDFNFCIEKEYNLLSSYYYRGVIFIAHKMIEDGCSDLNLSLELGSLKARGVIEKYCESIKKDSKD